ncbi:MAG: hypothetical protein V4512_02115 [Pseudomonadota bacterium]|nr:hypothetical protein [Sphingobium sp. KCTC 72723]
MKDAVMATPAPLFTAKTPARKKCFDQGNQQGRDLFRSYMVFSAI